MMTFFYFFETIFVNLLIVIGVVGQNCIIDQAIGNVVEVGLDEPILETTPTNTILWSSQTLNVEQAAAYPSPHARYINGLRYPLNYEYLTSGIFQEFITRERSLIIERNVSFVCSDSRSRDVYFRFHLLDENTSPPEFFGGPFAFTVVKRADSPVYEVITHSTNITVKDMDLDFKNAQVKISTSLPGVFYATIERITEIDPVLYGHTFSVEIHILWNTAAVQQYTFTLLADDGIFARTVSVIVDVIPE